MLALAAAVTGRAVAIMEKEQQLPPFLSLDVMSFSLSFD